MVHDQATNDSMPMAEYGEQNRVSNSLTWEKSSAGQTGLAERGYRRSVPGEELNFYLS